MPNAVLEPEDNLAVLEPEEKTESLKDSLLNGQEWLDTAKKFLPSSIVRSIAGVPENTPFIPDAITKPVTGAIKSTVGDIAGSLPGATPGFRKAAEGLSEGATDTALGFANPDAMVGGSAIKAGGVIGQAAKASFAAQMASQAPKAYDKLKQAAKHGDESDIAKAAFEVAADTGLPLAIVKGEAFPESKPLPPEFGNRLTMPQGAEKPHFAVLEPEPQLERKPNEETNVQNVQAQQTEVGRPAVESVLPRVNENPEPLRAASPPAPEVQVNAPQPEATAIPKVEPEASKEEVNIEKVTSPYKPVTTPELTPENSPTATKNAIVDQERVKRGLPPAIEPERRSRPEVWDRVMKKIDSNPQWQDNLISELRDNPRAVTDEENDALLQRQVTLHNSYGELTRNLSDLHEKGETESIPENRARLAAVSDQLLDLYNINKRVGTETGRGLNARKMMANEDFSLAQMELGKRAANDGRPLTDKEREQLVKLHDEIKGWQDKYDAHVQSAKERESDLQAKLEIERLRKEVKPIDPTLKRIADLVGKKLHTEADAARARIKARAFTFSAGLDPTVLADVAVIGAQHIFNGLHDFGDWSKKMVEDFSEKVTPHLQEIWKAANKKFDSTVGHTALEKAQAAKEAIKKLPTAKQVDRVLGKIKERLGSKKKDSITSQVQELALLIVTENPSIERDALIDQVHARLQSIDPNITRYEARDMISGYGDFKQLTKDQISIRLRDLKGQMQQVAKLEAMQSDQPPLKTGVERRTPSREESLLIRQVNDAKREFQVPITDPGTQLKSSLDTLKTRMKTRIIDYEKKLSEKDFTTKPKREIKLDQEAFRLKNEAEKAKQKYQSGLQADRLKNRTVTQKALDTMVKWSRGFLLSGPSTLAKLTGAAFWRLVSNPIESAAGSVLKRVPGISQIASRAPIEGEGLNLKTEAKAYTQGLMRGINDAWQTAKTGKSELDRIFGSRQDTGIGELDDEQKSVVDFFGHIHGALKAPVKRIAFERAVQQQANFYTKKGVDITDPMVTTKIMVEAYKRANRDIFTQKNRYADAIRRMINRLEDKDKATGRIPDSAKLAASASRVLLPIVKVPTNIVGETLEYAVGSISGLKKAARAVRQGVDTLKPEEADIIMRELKKGSVGAALLLTGFFAPKIFGGFYQQGQKRKPGDVQYGGAKIGNTEIPKVFLHAPGIETIQLGATVRRVAESKLRKKDKTAQGIPAGLLAGALGLADDIPFVNEMVETSRLFNPYERTQWLGELAKSRIDPQLLSQTAEYFDRDKQGNKIKRKPETVLQGIESGIPGLRQNVPVQKTR